MSTTAIVIATFLLVTVLPQSESFVVRNASNSDRQLYRTIGEISFTSGQFTKGLHKSSRPKLNCVQGGNGCVDACNSIEIDKMDCQQMEYGERNALWKCETSSIDKSKFSIQKATVLCEGWDNNTDSYVSLDSCFVEYAVCRTGDGGRHLVRRQFRPPPFGQQQPPSTFDEHKDEVEQVQRETQEEERRKEEQRKKDKEKFDKDAEKDEKKAKDDFNDAATAMGIGFILSIVLPIVACCIVAIIVGIVIFCIVRKTKTVAGATPVGSAGGYPTASGSSASVGGAQQTPKK